MVEFYPRAGFLQHLLQTKDNLWVITCLTAFFSKSNNFFWPERAWTLSYRSLANLPLLALARCTLAFTISMVLNIIFPKPRQISVARRNRDRMDGRHILIEGFSAALVFLTPQNILRPLFILLMTGFTLTLIGLSVSSVYSDETPDLSRQITYSPRRRTRSGHVFSLVPLMEDLARAKIISEVQRFPPKTIGCNRPKTIDA